MLTAVTLDDELLAKATHLTGGMDRAALLAQALRALTERESARRLQAAAPALGCAWPDSTAH